MHGGVCAKGMGMEYSCKCTDDYTGKRCGIQSELTNYQAKHSGITVIISILERCQAANAKVAALVHAMRFECNDDGTYKGKQCYEDLNNCWCVDPVTGEEIDDTRMYSNEFNLDCDKGGKLLQFPHTLVARIWRFICNLERRKYADGTCGAVRQKMMAEDPEQAMKILCDLSGNYDTTQCDGTSCWCVDKMSGKVIDGTTRPNGDQSINCDELPDTTTSAPTTTG